MMVFTATCYTCDTRKIDFLDVFSLNLWAQLQVKCRDSTEFPLRLDYGRSPHANVNQRLQIQLQLLMMSGMPLETCWAFNERWKNKFCYKVAICWLFLLKYILIFKFLDSKLEEKGYAPRNSKAFPDFCLDFTSTQNKHHSTDQHVRNMLNVAEMQVAGSQYYSEYPAANVFQTCERIHPNTDVTIPCLWASWGSIFSHRPWIMTGMLKLHSWAHQNNKIPRGEKS